MPNTPKSAPKDIDTFVRYPEDDNLSLGSMGSRMSSSSHLSAFSTLDLNEKDDSIIQASTPVAEPLEQYAQLNEDTQLDIEIPAKESESTDIFIGTIFDQNLVFYTTRLVCSKFLLSGRRHQLISDSVVRVSIKNVALLVVAQCVRLCPDVLLNQMTCNNILPKNHTFLDNVSQHSDDSNELDAMTVDGTNDTSTEPQLNKTDDIQLNIIDDYFGTSADVPKLDYMSPLSKSVDTALSTPAAKLDHHLAVRAEALNKNLIDIWSKSEIIEIKHFPEPPESSGVVKCVDDDQLMQDVLLYYNNTDPILRGNVQIIVGNCISAILLKYKSFEQFECAYGNDVQFLESSKLLQILMKVRIFNFFSIEV